MAGKYENDFCSEMRDNTEKIHDESDKLINLKIVAALTDTKIWSQAIADFYYVFRQIEISLDKLKNDPRLGVLHFCAEPEFRRTELFQKDLQYYLGNEWSSIVKPSEVAVKYCARIEEVLETKPVLIIAYVHSMYLALLAGGAMLKRIVKKTLGLSGQEGLALFSFGSESINRTELRGRVKDTINAITLTREEKNEILKEKTRVFQMNNSIANSLPVSLSSYRRFLALTSSLVIVLALAAGVVVSRFGFWQNNVA